MRPSDEKIIFGSTKKFEHQTDWKPLRTIDETLTSMLEYWDRTLPNTGKRSGAKGKKRWPGIDCPAKPGQMIIRNGHR